MMRNDSYERNFSLAIDIRDSDSFKDFEKDALKAAQMIYKQI